MKHIEKEVENESFSLQDQGQHSSLTYDRCTYVWATLALQEIGRWMVKVKQFLNAEFMNKRLVFIRKSNDSDKVL